jgi:hypothetical protein
MSAVDPRWFRRPPLERAAPDRRARNFYRSAANGGPAIAGIPLESTEAAVVAAVRMAYKVAEAQVDRSARLARRLREEGDRAVGPRSDRQALDATERLVFRALMAFLGWIEGVASDRGHPVKRLAVAEYRLLGSLLGLTPSERRERPHADAREPAPSTAPPEEPPPVPVRIQHLGKERRAVRISAWEYGGDTSRPATIRARFHHVDRGSVKPFDGEIVIGDRRSVTLKLATSGALPAGRWRAALCDSKDFQVGHIEIML